LLPTESGCERRGFMRLAISVVTGSIILLAVGCSPTRSVEAFCANLDDGHQRLESISAEAQRQPSPLASFVVAFGGLGEYEQLLDDLAESAPEDIRDDMERTRDVFAEQSEPIDDLSASRVLGQLSANISTSLANAPAFMRVDEFATTQCGTPVFGFAAVAEAFGGEPAAAGASSDDDPAAELCPDQPPPVEANDTRAQLQTALAAAADVGVTSTQQLAELLEEHDDLPSDALEALGHLRWRISDVDLDQQLTDLNTDTLDTCGQPAITDELRSAFEDQHPQPTEDGGTLGTYGRTGPCTSFDVLGFDGDHILFECSPVVGVVVLDTATGALEIHEPGRVLDTPPVLSDGDVFWVERRETPASGLQSASTDYALIRSGGPGQTTEDMRVWEDPEDQPVLAGGGGGRLLLNTGGVGQVTDLEGATEVQLPGRMTGAYHVFDAMYQLVGTHEDRDRSHVIDLRTLETAEMHGTFGESDVCLGLYGNWKSTLEVRPDGELQVHELEAPLNTVVRPVDGGLVQPAREGGVERVAADGERIWHLPPDVIERWEVFAGQVLIRTADSTRVAVNADTGDEEPIMGGVFAEALLAQGNVVVNHTTGEVVAHGPDRGTFTRGILPDCQIRS
jgi:hypothetical protein